MRKPATSERAESRRTSPLAADTPSLWVEIDREKLLNNLGIAKNLAGPGVGLIAVVKANAYGHGLEIVASTLEPHVDMFAVTKIQEALRLREHGIETPVLILGPVAAGELKSVIRIRSVITISSLEEANQLNQEAEKLNRNIFVHVKIDTGMGRLGISSRDALEHVLKIAGLSRIRITGLYTHFPSADEPKSLLTQKQVKRFGELTGALKRKRVELGSTHLSNSSALVLSHACGGSMARPGIMLYGVLPGSLSGSAGRLGLKPVLSWKAKVIFVKELLKGETCGYGCAYKASRRIRIALLPVGYSHGYPFALSSKAEVLIKGKRYPVAGRVSMDFLALAIGKGSNIAIGDTVTLIGGEGNDEITVTEIAERARTVPYEIMTGIHPSIRRRCRP
ncbi:MAG: alanine racemase [Candidatus Omnitrophica bacterium]|nr:alanine racemase [Candidatus Omnitrophota bacterium]